MELRLIIQSSESGELEFVDFTEKLDEPVESFARSDCSIDFDGIVSLETEAGADVNSFPVGYTLKKVWL